VLSEPQSPLSPCFVVSASKDRENDDNSDPVTEVKHAVATVGVVIAGLASVLITKPLFALSRSKDFGHMGSGPATMTVVDDSFDNVAISAELKNQSYTPTLASVTTPARAPQKAPAAAKPRTVGELWKQQRMQDLRTHGPKIAAGTFAVLAVGYGLYRVQKARSDKEMAKTAAFLKRNMSDDFQKLVDQEKEKLRLSSASPLPPSPSAEVPAKSTSSSSSTSSASKGKKEPSIDEQVQQTIEDAFNKAAAESGDKDGEGADFLKRLQDMFKGFKPGGGAQQPSSEDIKQAFGLQDEDMAGVEKSLERIQRWMQNKLNPDEKVELSLDLGRTVILMTYPEVFDVAKDEVKAFTEMAKALSVNFKELLQWKTFEYDVRAQIFKEVIDAALVREGSDAGSITPAKQEAVAKIEQDMDLTLEQSQSLADEVRVSLGLAPLHEVKPRVVVAEVVEDSSSQAAVPAETAVGGEVIEVSATSQSSSSEPSSPPPRQPEDC